MKRLLLHAMRRPDNCQVTAELAVGGTGQTQWKFAFAQAFKAIDRRIKLFLSLSIASIEQLQTKKRMDAIGKTDDAL
jgi:hypothetical protein